MANKSKKANGPLVVCSQCKGHGKVELSETLQATLRLFKGRGQLTAKEVAAKFQGITVNAINNRLSDLKQFGFLVAHRDGKTLRYQRADEQPKAVE